jgi:hypothetical protein
MTLSDVGANPLVVLRSKAIRIQPFGMLHVESNHLVILSINYRGWLGRKKREPKLSIVFLNVASKTTTN